VAVALLWADGVRAVPIDDADFFADIQHTLLTFDQDRGGNAVVFGEGADREMPGDEYADLGVLFSPPIHWVNDAGFGFDSAQAVGGSPPIMIPGPRDDDFTLNFTAPVRAFGFWVINNSTTGVNPRFDALASDGGLIESVTFGPRFRDGTFPETEYGFMGIAADRDIASVRVVKDATGLDNLRLSAFPEPAVLPVVGLALGGARVRRRPRGVGNGGGA
jgi:hypothetical protein